MSGRSHLLARPDRNREPIFSRRVGAVVLGVVVAERMKCPVEVEIVYASGRAIEFEIPSARIRFGAVGEIAERHEQVIDVLLTDFDKRRQREQMPFQRKRQLSDPVVRAAFASGRRDLDDISGAIDCQRCRYAIFRFDRKLGQRGKRRASVRRNRRLR